MAAKKLPDAVYLRECFDYNPKTGKLTWKKRPLSHFPTQRAWNTWNTRRTGTIVNTKHGNGKGIIVKLNISKRNLFVHRIIWKWMTNKEPGTTIDHINNDPFDNRWSNLREATTAQNAWNSRGKHPETRQLPKGVSVAAHNNRFRAEIGYRRKRYYLGTFDTPEQAHAAYAEASARLHGEFKNLGHQPPLPAGADAGTAINNELNARIENCAARPLSTNVSSRSSAKPTRKSTKTG
jgi:hypothetical protein